MNRPAGPSRISLLLFSVGPYRFGIDTDEAESVSAYDGKPADDLFWFHKELDFGDVSTAYRLPTVITPKAAGPQSFRIIIDAMEEIAEIAWSDIHPFPPLLEPFALGRGMWGILPHRNEMVLLVELKRLWKNKRPGQIAEYAEM